MAAEAGPAQTGLAPPEGETGPDGEIIGGPRTPQQIAAQRRLQQTQAQVDEVVDIMKTNMDKVLDRDVKLSELDDRADALQYGASQFEQQAKSLKNKFWLQNLKMMIIMGVIGVVIIGLLFAYKCTETCFMNLMNKHVLWERDKNAVRQLVVESIDPIVKS